MDQNEAKLILEAALLAANGSLSFDKLVELFTARGVDVDRAVLREALKALAEDYASRQIELKETASGFRIQIRSSARDWLQPLFEERAPRYTRALLETLALVAYRQPITRAEIEDVRGVAVSSNIIRTLMERGWIRIVGHREVPGKPSMLGTTREFLDYFGLKKLEDLPTLAEVRELGPSSDPQSDFVDDLAALMKESEESAVAVDVAEGAETAPTSEEASTLDESREADPDVAIDEAAEADPAEAAETAAAGDGEASPNVVPIQQSEA